MSKKKERRFWPWLAASLIFAALLFGFFLSLDRIRPYFISEEDPGALPGNLDDGGALHEVVLDRKETSAVKLPETVQARIPLRQRPNGALVGWEEMRIQASAAQGKRACKMWKLHKTFTYRKRYRTRMGSCRLDGLPDPPTAPEGAWLLVVEEPADPLRAVVRSAPEIRDQKLTEALLMFAAVFGDLRAAWFEEATQAEAGPLEPMRTFSFRVHPDEASCREALAKTPAPPAQLAEADLVWLRQAIAEQEARVAAACETVELTRDCRRSRTALKYLRRRLNAPLPPQKLDPPHCKAAAN